MATSVVIQSTVATGDTIEAARENQNRDNFSIIDVRTGGDPGGAGKRLVSTGALAAAWVTEAASITDAMLVNDKVNVAGDTMTGALNFGNGNKRVVQFGDSITLQAAIDRAILGGATPIMAQNAAWDGSQWVHINGAAAAALLVVENGGINLYTGPAGGDPISFTPAGTVWHSGNDGPSSGLAAQTAATATSATSATTATSASDSAALGGVAAASYARKDAASDFSVAPTIGGQGIITAATIGSQSVASAGSAANATQLGGVAAASYARKGTSTYAGNNASSQNVAMGFAYAFVIVQEVTDGTNGCMAIVTVGGTVNSIRSSGVTTVIPDTTVGLSGATLQAGLGVGLNTSGKTYRWFGLA